MALVRILVDGFSLLHAWPALAAGNPRHSSVAREELINRLTQYHDVSGVPITVVFDGARSSRGPEETSSTASVEILYSRVGQTADQVIERVTGRLSAYGDVLVVTNDRAEQETVSSLGGNNSSCEAFIQTVETALTDLEKEVRAYNQKERVRFRTP